eukprot:TRINITY_DN9371_c0_g1_i1.p1 TRINITY_DN9371_c0_g1~~TRINITY_DN9371_c0_g1_i1.p1  ORF type:complete len:470 (-),score=73.26 TRINITY_DN9371_c0_g1_i1:9-1418(-)
MQVITDREEMLQYITDATRIIGLQDDIEVKYVSPEVGKGLFAKRDLEEDEIILVENPFVITIVPPEQEYRTKRSACHNCMKYIGPIENHIHYLVEKCGVEAMKIEDYKYELPYFEECYPTKIIQPVDCEHCKLVSYCSESCKERAWYEFHEALCVGPNPGPDHPVIKFEDFAWKFCDNFMLAERMLAMIILEARRCDGDIIKAWEPWQYYLQGSWVELMVRQMHEEDADDEELRKILIERAGVGIEMLKDILYKPELDDERVLSSVFNIDFFDRLLAIGNLNCACMNMYSPLSSYIKKLNARETSDAELDSFSETVMPLDVLKRNYYNNSVPPFASCIGMCLVHSCFNHSCRPNAISIGGFGFGKPEDRVKEEGEEARISIVALKPIAKGEEITINYLDDDDTDYKSRQQMLWEKYLFKCHCSKCLEEKAQLEEQEKNEKEAKINENEDAVKEQPKEEEQKTETTSENK